MKRERVRIDDGWREYGTKTRRPRAFVYKPRKAVSTSPSPNILDDAEPADPVFASIMDEISSAAAAERAGWAKLNRYLRPRIRT